MASKKYKPFKHVSILADDFLLRFEDAPKDAAGPDIFTEGKAQLRAVLHPQLPEFMARLSKFKLKGCCFSFKFLTYDPLISRAIQALIKFEDNTQLDGSRYSPFESLIFAAASPLLTNSTLVVYGRAHPHHLDNLEVVKLKPEFDKDSLVAQSLRRHYFELPSFADRSIDLVKVAGALTSQAKVIFGLQQTSKSCCEGFEKKDEW